MIRADTPVEAFITQQRHLIELERRAEIEESQRQHALLSAEELQRRGQCLLRLSIAESFIGMRGRLHLRLVSARGGDLPAHRMQPGDVVAVRASSLGSDEPPTGVVARVQAAAVVVALDREPDEGLDGSVRLDRVANDVTYRRLLAGLDRIASAERGRAARLRDVCLGQRDPRPVDPLAVEFLDRALDASQQAAASFALGAPDLALVHGPPGTGKTTTLIEIIRQLVARGERVLACAGSNIAVDNLVERLLPSGIPLVRLGHPARLLPAVVAHSLDAQLDEALDDRQLRDMRRAVDVHLKRMHRTRDRAERHAMRYELRTLRDDLRAAEQHALRSVLAGASVVLTTNVGAGDSRLAGMEFDCVVIDEAAQALEASCWIPLLRAERLILAGDHRQLPPTIRSAQAEREGLAVTLFERMAGEHPSLCRMLETQYRMHEAIMAWSSRALYEGRLVAHASVRAHRLCELPGVFETPDTVEPLVFIDTAGFDAPERTDEHGESRWNDGESRLVCGHVERLLAAGVPATGIGVITPYNAQVDNLRRRLEGLAKGLEIDTVDGFQGREKEAIVLSLVRSNERGEIGFLADQRRLNVAVTRARRHLAVIGDSATISCDAFLAGLVEHLSTRGRHLSAYEVAATEA